MLTLKCRISEYQEEVSIVDTVNPQGDLTNDRVNKGNDPVNGNNDTINTLTDTITDTITSGNDTLKDLPELHRRLVEAIRIKPEITRQEMIVLLNTSNSTISKALKKLQGQGNIKRKGARKNGKWVILK